MKWDLQYDPKKNEELKLKFKKYRPVVMGIHNNLEIQGYQSFLPA